MSYLIKSQQTNYEGRKNKVDPLGDVFVFETITAPSNFQNIYVVIKGKMPADHQLSLEIQIILPLEVEMCTLHRKMVLVIPKKGKPCCVKVTPGVEKHELH